MPPIIDIQIVNHPVTAGAIEPFPPDCGAECLFLGRTRAETHPTHGRLERLSYEAYEPMAKTVLKQLADDAVRDYKCAAVRIHHAVGDVPLGEASVLIQVAAGHRAEAFAACRLLIDRLKKEAPIWKREAWSDGTTWSKGAPAPGATGQSQEIRTS